MQRWRLLWFLSFQGVSRGSMGESVIVSKNRMGNVDLRWYLVKNSFCIEKIVLIEVLKQLKTLTFLFLLYLFFPKNMFF